MRHALAHFEPHNMLLPVITKGSMIALCTLLAYIGGEVLAKGGVVAAIVGALVALAIEGLKTAVAMRRERLNEQREQLNQFEIIEERLNLLHTQEKAFLQTQITYLEALELATRNRLHAMGGETSRAVLHIRLCEDYIKEHAPDLKLAPFVVKTTEEIYKPYPLPDSPREQLR